MNRISLVILALVAVLGLSIWKVTRQESAADSSAQPLLVHCAAALREPVSQIARQYELEFGIPVHLQFGGSGALEAQLEIAGGDLYLPADESYIHSAQAKRLIRESTPVATLTAGIVVPKGNPKNLHSLADLARPGIRLSLAERSAAIGRHTWSILEQSGHLKKIHPNVIVTKPTVNNIVEDVATGAVDATLAWDAVAHAFKNLEWVPVSEFSAEPRTAMIGILSASKQPDHAHHFAHFLTAHDRSLATFKRFGFAVSEP